MVSQHIWEAFNEPEKTLPYVDDKEVPSVLHRLFWDVVRREANRNQAKITCNVHFPGHESCDEYPFASTYEGAAASHYGEPFGRYSAKGVPLSENRTAGGFIGNWYGADRILDGDQFRVEVP